MIGSSSVPDRALVREEVDLHLCGVCRERCCAAFAAARAAGRVPELPIRVSEAVYDLLKLRRAQLRVFGREESLPARFLPDEEEPRKHLAGLLHFMECSRPVWRQLPRMQVKPVITARHLCVYVINKLRKCGSMLLH